MKGIGLAALFGAVGSVALGWCALVLAGSSNPNLTVLAAVAIAWAGLTLAAYVVGLLVKKFVHLGPIAAFGIGSFVPIFMLVGLSIVNSGNISGLLNNYAALALGIAPSWLIMFISCLLAFRMAPNQSLKRDAP